MKKIVLLINILLQYFNSYSQFTPREWIIGQGGGNPYNNQKLDFSSGALTVQSLIGLNNGISVTSAAIGDISHPILFYTNGIRIWNYLNDVIQNGDTLNPCANTFANIPYGLYLPQMDVFIPDPGDTNKLYLFHASGDINYQPCPTLTGGYFPDKLYYSQIDKTLDSGNGGVISKNNIMINDTIGQSLIAIKHGNGRDWWVIARHSMQPIWLSWLITPSGISPLPLIQNVGPIACAGFHNLKFSSLTNKVAGFKAYFDNNTRYIDLYDFDRCTGLFSNPQTLTINHYFSSLISGGCEFSPSGRYLYAGVYDELHQFDLLAPNIQASETVVDTLDTLAWLYNKQTWGMMQLGPDGKIYANTNNSSNTYLGVINFPDSGGAGCNAVHGGVVLPSVHYNDLPNIPLYELGPLAGSACDTLTAGMEDITLKHDVFVYPNPAKDVVTITSATEKIKAIELTGLTGQTIYSQKVNNANSTQLDLSNYAPGFYFVKISGADYSVVMKVIKE